MSISIKSKIQTSFYQIQYTYVFLILCLFSIFIGTMGCSSNEEPSSIYYGGEILTMAGSGNENAEAVLVKNNLIVLVGSKKEIFRQKEPNTKLIDLKGKTLMPGFIAIHTHPDLSAYLHSFVDLSGFNNDSPEAVWARLEKKIANTPKGNWIFCKGYDPMLVKGLKAPDIKKLDTISPNNPLVILAQSLHSAWANSLAFKEIGITADTVAPARGSYYEKDENGMLTGFIAEVAAIEPFSKVAVETFDIKQNVLNVYDDYIKNGFTSITSMGLFAQDSKPFLLYEHLSTGHPRLIHKVLDFFGFLPDKKPTVRHFVYAKHDTPFLIPETVNNGDDFFKVVGIKLWYDGSPYTGSMYLKEPYLNSELMREGLNIPHNHYGKSVIEKDKFYELVKFYHDKGWQLSIHSQGDRSTADVLDIMGKVISSSTQKDLRHRIEHGVLLPSELLGKIKQLNMTPSFHINHIYYYGQALREDILGYERAEKMLPVKSALKQNLHVSLHADAPMYPENPLHLLQTAVTRKTKSGLIIGAHEKITVLDGLKALTINPAWQLHMEEKLGSIEPGKYVDLIILDKNPLKVSVDKLKDIRIIKTIINGVEI